MNFCNYLHRFRTYSKMKYNSIERVVQFLQLSAQIMKNHSKFQLHSYLLSETSLGLNVVIAFKSISGRFSRTDDLDLVVSAWKQSELGRELELFKDATEITYFVPKCLDSNLSWNCGSAQKRPGINSIPTGKLIVRSTERTNHLSRPLRSGFCVWYFQMVKKKKKLLWMLLK